ncbi:type II toxin-antitoxin system PemK/MazF family toxin [Clostridium algoriphilum]|uniref:type II toxin-antitoxin system PemK/MazF family toxin n=1 Tax=Clostridium algoriphilum TaxID=198347 RepID=UPI001CF10D2A|nr:type II toxin-antitoxin system PemK/MazF family toxin [Clostridium algoriphilum]MCB2294342.1 type II toxin-antitoxin system PemK/MazF family toxin [Clostridium algoriphilum]
MLPIIRPVIIIQNDIGNKYSSAVTVVPGTSRINKTKFPTHVEIEASKCGLKTDIVILTEKVQTIAKSRVKEKLGRITHNDLRKIDTALLIQLGIV